MVGDDSGTAGDDSRTASPESGPEPDPERAALLREVAEEVRGDSSESEQVAAMLYRVSDCYDPEEETTPADVYLNMRNILRVKERGGMPERE